MGVLMDGRGSKEEWVSGKKQKQLMASGKGTNKLDQKKKQKKVPEFFGGREGRRAQPWMGFPNSNTLFMIG